MQDRFFLAVLGGCPAAGSLVGRDETQRKKKCSGLEIRSLLATSRYHSYVSNLALITSSRHSLVEDLPNCLIGNLAAFGKYSVLS